MKFSTSGLFSVMMAVATYAAPVADANANAVADADAEAWRWHRWVRGVAIYKRDADANADADAWRWHRWVRGVAIYKREDETSQPDEEPLGMAYAFASNETDAEPVAYYPIFASDLETQLTELLNEHPEDLQLEKREAEADADADAWRWHRWVRGVAIYKREDVESQPENWEWHVTFDAPEEADFEKREAEANADADAWRWHRWVRGVAIY
ncbi:hypothetical protein CANINC_005075 [Pichia inconspicua]|uniref:Mating factor alpha n=1 Tax=Pichia inconspicua TaxID=52247 RepID=A0A4T0WVP0_9ASCO|nr:hypothetical protein CANINC_005075 [[Candida] inconspicua]